MLNWLTKFSSDLNPLRQVRELTGMQKRMLMFAVIAGTPMAGVATACAGRIENANVTLDEQLNDEFGKHVKKGFQPGVHMLNAKEIDKVQIYFTNLAGWTDGIYDVYVSDDKNTWTVVPGLANVAVTSQGRITDSYTYNGFQNQYIAGRPIIDYRYYKIVFSDTNSKNQKTSASSLVLGNTQIQFSNPLKDANLQTPNSWEVFLDQNGKLNYAIQFSKLSKVMFKLGDRYVVRNADEVFASKDGVQDPYRLGQDGSAFYDYVLKNDWIGELPSKFTVTDGNGNSQEMLYVNIKFTAVTQTALSTANPVTASPSYSADLASIGGTWQFLPANDTSFSIVGNDPAYHKAHLRLTTTAGGVLQGGGATYVYPLAWDITNMFTAYDPTNPAFYPIPSSVSSNSGLIVIDNASGGLGYAQPIAGGTASLDIQIDPTRLTAAQRQQIVANGVIAILVYDTSSNILIDFRFFSFPEEKTFSNDPNGVDANNGGGGTVFGPVLNVAASSMMQKVGLSSFDNSFTAPTAEQIRERAGQRVAAIQKSLDQLTYVVIPQMMLRQAAAVEKGDMELASKIKLAILFLRDRIAAEQASL